MAAIAGLTLGIPTGSTSVALTSASATKFLLGDFVGDKFRVSLFWWIAVVAIVRFILNFSIYGNWILAVGGDTVSACNAGIPTDRLTIALFMSSGLCAAFVRMSQAILYNSAQVAAGQSFIFNSIIVVVIGGVLLTGGYGSVVGIVLGALTFSIVDQGIFYTRLRRQLGEPHHRRPPASRGADEQYVPQHGVDLRPAREREGPLMTTPLLKLTGVTKSFGPIDVLHDITLETLSGVHKPTSGSLEMNGKPVAFDSPRDASTAGIATVHQFGGTFPLMSIGRSFFVGAEPTKRWGPFAIFDRKKANEIAVRETRQLGVTRIDDGNRLVGGLSGSERQALAIARAVHFGAGVLILDEPVFDVVMEDRAFGEVALDGLERLFRSAGSPRPDWCARDSVPRGGAHGAACRD